MAGYASTDFAVKGVIPASREAMKILSDYEYQTPEGHLCGVFVFERAGLLAGLELWSIDGRTTPSVLPAIKSLKEIRT